MMTTTFDETGHEQATDATGTWCVPDCAVCKPKPPATKAVACGQVNQGLWCQETYETASGHARLRAAELRKAGYKVTVSPLGMQVTSLGKLKLTLVDIRPGLHEDTANLPPVKVERV